MLTGRGRLLPTLPNVVRILPLHASSAGQVSENSGKPRFRACTRRHYPWPRLLTYRHALEDSERSFPYYPCWRHQLASELAPRELCTRHAPGHDHRRLGGAPDAMAPVADLRSP
jgi:hypothetical protein